jgi:type VI secretion system protein ImpK
VGDKRNLLARYVPLWVIGAVAALIIMLIFFGFLYSINQASAPIISQTFEIKDNLDKPTTSPVQAAPTHSYVEKFRVFLSTEIQQKQVSVDNQAGKTIVKVIAPNFFGSGGDSIQAKYQPLLKKIAKALTTVSEPIMIVGHTDNDPIFTARFPSNWDLSNARAKAVADFINKENRGSKKTVSYEGRADTQNLVPNDSRANKALNRRIEIIF